MAEKEDDDNADEDSCMIYLIPCRAVGPSMGISANNDVKKISENSDNDLT